MAQLVYKPAGAAEQRFEVDLEKLMSPEAEAIERVTGETFGDFTVKLQKGSMLALRALLWVLLKRGNPPLKFGDVSFCLDEIDLLSDDDEEEVPKAPDNGDGSPT